MKQKKDLNSWICWVFDHPVTEPAWHWKSDAIEMDLPPTTLAEYIALLFQDAQQHLDRFSNDQLAQGFWFLVGSMCSNQLQVWFDEQVSWELRRSGIVATETLFREIFARRGSLHFTPESDGGLQLDTAGYMWWDIMPGSSQRPNTDSHYVHSECIDVMNRILQIESPVCRYSALHGLGHWQDYDQDRAFKAIDRFLRNTTGYGPKLRQYARDAREGNIQ